MSLSQHPLASRHPHQIHRPRRRRSPESESDAPPRLPIASLSRLPGSARGLQRTTLGDLQRLHGNAHVRRLLNGTRARQTASVQRQPAATPTLGPGSRGQAVVTLQQQLNSAGASLQPDGIFGGGTRAAVVTFQQRAGLTADGIVGPQTWSKLQGGGGSEVPVTSTATAAVQPDPQQAVLLGKLGQVRVAMKTLNAKSGSPQAQAAPSGDKTTLKPSVGAPIPSCGMPVPTGSTPVEEDAHAGHGQGVLQRSFLDDAESWLDDTASSAGEWVGEKAQAAEDAVSSASSWVGDQVNEAGKWAEEQVSSASQWVDDKVTGASEWVSEEVNQAVSGVQEVVGAAKDAVEGGIDVVVQTASELAKDVGEFGDDLKKRFANEIAIVQQVIQDLGKAIPDIPGLIKQLDDLLSGLTGAGATNWMGWFGVEDKGPEESQVYALFDVASTMTRGGVKVPGGTGYSQPTFSFAPPTWWRATDDAIMVQSKLNIDCHYEIASEGRGTSIDSADHSAVTEVSYLTIINDLEALKNGGGATTTYWSEPIVERHEQFHCRDYIGEATKYLPTAQGWLETQKVKHPGGNDTSVDPQVQKLIGDTRQKIEDDGRKYFDDGGEARAYGDGKASYDALINQIKAKAKSKKWKGVDLL